MTDFQINLEEVTFTYEDGVEALSNLSFKARPGEFVVVLGANGAGKSTLCFLLSGIVPHIFGGRRTGQVDIAGRDPWDDPLFVTAQRCGVLLQDPEVQLFNPSVFTELAFGPANLGLPREVILRHIEETLKLLHLTGLEQRNPRDLSGGQKQRVALGGVLSMQPRVLVLDEPTSQLDPLGREEVVAALHRLKSTGQVSVVMTTHETDDILDLADRVLVLEGGKAVLDGPPGEVFSQTEALAAAGVKLPAALELLASLGRLANEPLNLTGAEVTEVDALHVAERARTLLEHGHLRVSDGNGPLPAARSNGADCILEAVNLTYQYPGHPPVTALNDVNLTIREGEFVGIIGQNGSGKSTLVKSFVGLLRPTRGEVRVGGQNIRKMSVGEMARRVGLVLQNPDYQLFAISSREEIYFGLRNLGIEGPRAEAITAEVLRWVGLEKEIETFPFRMSFGDRRKLAVAATVALDPQVLILDEPTTAQDHRGRYQLAEIGRRFREEKGRTVLMITHDMELVARYAERLIVMWNGQVLLDGPTAEVFGEFEALKRSFLRPPMAAEVAAALRSAGVTQGLLTPQALLSALQPRGE